MWKGRAHPPERGPAPRLVRREIDDQGARRIVSKSIEQRAPEAREQEGAMTCRTAW